MTEPLDDTRGELLEHIAEIIRDEVRITADGIIYNSADVAKIILNRAAPARCDAESASLWVCTGCGSRKSIEQIRGEHPEAIACCPERKMAPTVPSTHQPGPAK